MDENIEKKEQQEQEEEKAEEKEEEQEKKEEKEKKEKKEEEKREEKQEKQEEKEGKPTKKPGLSGWHDKYYKILLIIPAIILIISLVYLYSFYQENQDVINKDISLKGGTSITVHSQTDIVELKTFLSTKFDDFTVREISDLRTGRQEAFIVEVSVEPEVIEEILEEYLGFSLNEENSDVEFTGSSLGAGFYSQLRLALILAFILMSIVVFIIFRTFVPSLAVILAAFTDIIMTVALVDFLGMRISAAGIVAFLMLIGYSVDSDILLTTKALKETSEKLNSRLFSAFKTGITMTLTSIIAISISLFIVKNFSPTLTQIFTILLIGLGFDLINTWITNIGILKWYCEKRRIE